MRKKAGPRIWLERRRGRPAFWVIKDGAHKVSTGLREDQYDEAVKKLGEYLSDSRPDTSIRSLSEILIADVLRMYAQDIPADSPSRATRGYHIQALLPFWGEKTLSDVKGSTCRSYLKQRVERPSRASIGSRSVKPSTARQELKTLQAAINHWHRESPLAAVPQVTLPKANSRRERVLSRNEVARLLWAARGPRYKHVARFILIGIYTGTRHEAILRLRWKDSATGGHIDTDRGIVFRRGSTERETSKRRPPVQLAASLRSRVLLWKEKDLSTFSETSSYPVIHYNGEPLKRIHKAFGHVVKAAGLGPDVTPHTLRHTAASWLLAEGKTIWDVAGILGADASTIERVYGHYMPLEERKRA